MPNSQEELDDLQVQNIDALPNDIFNQNNKKKHQNEMYQKSDKVTKNSNQDDNINKNNYNQSIQPFLKEQAKAKDFNTQMEIQKMMQQNNPIFQPNQLSQYQQTRPLEDGGGIVNNIINPNGNNIPNNNQKNQYTGSSELDLIRDVYRNTNDISLKLSQYEKEFIKDCNSIVLDKKYADAISESGKEKGKFKPIKKFKGWKGQLAIPMTRLLENTDENGEMSISDYDDFINGPWNDFKKELQADLASDKSPVEMKNFVKKALEEMEGVENNNGLTFNPTTLRYKFGILHRDLSDLYYNISVFDQIIMAIYDFFTFNNFYKDNKEIRDTIDSIYEDIRIYYKTPMEDRQFLVNQINTKMANIEYLLSNVAYLIKPEDLQIFKQIKADLSAAINPKMNSASFVVSMIKAFGQDAIKGVDIDVMNSATINAVKNALADSIMNDAKCSKIDSENYATALLTKKEKDDISGSEATTKIINAYFDGKVNGELKFMNKKMDEVNVMEDAKIKGNMNLQKVDAISKTSKAIVDAICVYVGKCNEEIENVKRKYGLLNATGIVMSEESINEDIKRIKTNMLDGIKNITKNAKENIFEYINDDSKRQKVVQDSKKTFEEDKKSIEKVMKDQLCDKDGPKAGEEEEVLKIKDILDNMKNIPEFSFNNWESINQIVLDLEKQINSNKEFHVIQSENNLFQLASHKSNIENRLIHGFLDNGWINSQKQHQMMPYR